MYITCTFHTCIVNHTHIYIITFVSLGTLRRHPLGAPSPAPGARLTGEGQTGLQHPLSTQPGTSMDISPETVPPAPAVRAPPSKDLLLVAWAHFERQRDTVSNYAATADTNFVFPRKGGIWFPSLCAVSLGRSIIGKKVEVQLPSTGSFDQQETHSMWWNPTNQQVHA